MEFLYVAVGSEGLVKVGRTKSPISRVPQLQTQFRKRGEEMVWMVFSRPVRTAIRLEALAISSLAAFEEEREPGREWFRDTDPISALRFIRRITNEQREIDATGVHHEIKVRLNRWDDGEADFEISPYERVVQLLRCEEDLRKSRLQPEPEAA
jgi:hypothetical protein